MPSGAYHSFFWQDQGAPPAAASAPHAPYAQVSASPSMSLSWLVAFLLARVFRVG